jgi:hypothetical protein
MHPNPSGIFWPLHDISYYKDNEMDSPYSVLIIDANAELTFSITRKFFKPVAIYDLPETGRVKNTVRSVRLCLFKRPTLIGLPSRIYHRIVAGMLGICVLIIHILTPFPHIAAHVINTQTIGGFGAHLMGFATDVSTIPPPCPHCCHRLQHVTTSLKTQSVPSPTPSPQSFSIADCRFLLQAELIPYFQVRQQHLPDPFHVQTLHQQIGGFQFQLQVSRSRSYGAPPAI